FGAGVGEKDAVETGDLSEAERELDGVLGVEEVRRVDEFRGLRGDGAGDRGVVVAKRAYADAGEQVEVVVAVLVAEVDAVAAEKEQRVALVGLQQQLRLGGLDFGESGLCLAGHRKGLVVKRFELQWWC